MKQNTQKNPLISVDEAIALHEQMMAGIADAVFADASYHLPAAGRDPDADFILGRIEGAVRFDIDKIADRQNPLPRTMPSADFFAECMRGLGINSDDEVIIYDDSAFYSGARAWYMLRLFGHCRVRVLNGGLAAWKAAGGAVESGPLPQGGDARPLPQGNFITRPACEDTAVILVDALKDIVALPDGTRPYQILDARGGKRFAGVEAETDPKLRSGHIPGAKNIPIASLIDSASGLFKTTKELEQIFAPIDAKKPIITTCGSGVTACGLALGLAAVGIGNVTLYDGSWSEWGGRPDCPISTGSA